MLQQSSRESHRECGDRQLDGTDFLFQYRPCDLGQGEDIDANRRLNLA